MHEKLFMFHHFFPPCTFKHTSDITALLHPHCNAMFLLALLNIIKFLKSYKLILFRKFVRATI